ncbi:Hypothetical predicted protein [Podarcis lilfordi]|uniref:Uncharacterized protein n=1 Tax=Podarcis lilfordi TaxID=74358 RepID=A0AA35KGK4_9SAUR|nr:Hypothetical predicted protein [Podarcis lilfordi]
MRRGGARRSGPESAGRDAAVVAAAVRESSFPKPILDQERSTTGIWQRHNLAWRVISLL